MHSLRISSIDSSRNVSKDFITKSFRDSFRNLSIDSYKKSFGIPSKISLILENLPDFFRNSSRITFRKSSKISSETSSRILSENLQKILDLFPPRILVKNLSSSFVNSSSDFNQNSFDFPKKFLPETHFEILFRILSEIVPQ